MDLVESIQEGNELGIRNGERGRHTEHLGIFSGWQYDKAFPQ